VFGREDGDAQLDRWGLVSDPVGDRPVKLDQP
jgi:hypothetical protein